MRLKFSQFFVNKWYRGPRYIQEACPKLNPTGDSCKKIIKMLNCNHNKREARNNRR